MSSLVETVTVRGCSDAAIAPLVTSWRTRLSNLSLATNAVSVSVDVRGNETVSVTALDPATQTSFSTTVLPGLNNVATNWYNDGMAVSNRSHSAVVTAIERDAHGRETARIDGRGNVSRTRYDAFGRVAANELNQYTAIDIDTSALSHTLAHPSGSSSTNLPSEAKLLRCISPPRETFTITLNCNLFADGKEHELRDVMAHELTHLFAGTLDFPWTASTNNAANYGALFE